MIKIRKKVNEDCDLRALLIEITQKCNAHCDQCGSRCDMDCEEKLTKEEILDVFKDIKRNIGTDVMINITGGEPLLRKDLFDIMTKASQMGFDWGMVTNGTLITDQVIQKMKQSKLKTITVSLDGLAETHEKLRHIPTGSFNNIVNSLKKLKEANFLDHIQVTFTANKKNIREGVELYNYLEGLHILDSFRTSFIDPIGRATDNLDLMLDKYDMEFWTNFANETNKAVSEKKLTLPIEWGCCHFLGDKLENRKFKCLAGKTVASILYNGDIFVCPNTPRISSLVQGNIRTDKFSTIWKTEFRQFRINKTYSYCENCRYKDECNGDSLHTWDFENNKPKFCYMNVFGDTDKTYEKYINKKYKSYSIIEVKDDPKAKEIWIEPEAYRDIESYFHFGKNSPVSMYEQQMGLIGFKIDSGYVIKYVFPSFVDRLANDYARFNKNTISQAMRELEIIKKEFSTSDDKDDYIGDGLVFLGFIHSHPIQKELQYSTGDESIHNSMINQFGDYIGILVNPKEILIGAYYGKDIIQGCLKILSND